MGGLLEARHRRDGAYDDEVVAEEQDGRGEHAAVERHSGPSPDGLDERLFVVGIACGGCEV